MARTITAPGVEIFERDESETSSLQAGTNILVQGFAHQGPTNELIHISSKDELNQIFFGGNGPTNDAEQYFYFSCAEVLNSPANLYVIRLPYGLSSGEGFSGKYVALAYGGVLRTVPVTEKVRRNVKEDDFIPGKKTSSDTDEIILYEFSENTIIENDPETGPIYTAIEHYLKEKYPSKEDPDTGEVIGFHPESGEDIWKYKDEFPIGDDEHWWLNTNGDAYSLDMSPLDRYCRTYDVPGYDLDEIVFSVPYTKIVLDTSAVESSAYNNPNKYEALFTDNQPTTAGSVNVTFKNVGQVTELFIDEVLKNPITLWDEAKEEVVWTGDKGQTPISPFQGLDKFYSKKSASGTTTLYRFEYGRAMDKWSEAIDTATASASGTVFKLRTAYNKPDLLANVYVKDAKNKNKRYLAGRTHEGYDENKDLDEGKLNMIVDTEKIADKIIEVFSDATDADDPTDVVFEKGVPMQDAHTQRESYDGPFYVEAMDPKTWARIYQINHYDNKLATDRIKEIEVDVPKPDEDGNILYKNVLTLNPNPVALPLSEYQYTAIQEGAINWSKPTYTLEGEGTGYDAFRTVLGKAAFYTINKMQTSIDDKYQGFYVAMMDHSKFVEKKNWNPGDPSWNNAIKEIDYVSAPDEDGNVTIEKLPSRAYNFDIAGKESLSVDIMDGTTELNLADEENFDNIVVATVRCGRRASSSDPSKLSYDIKDITLGSFNVGSTIIDRVTKARVPNRIDTKMLDNDYIEFKINEKFERTENMPKEVKFGGRDYPNRDQWSGTCCSLGLTVPCEEDNKAEYIGDVPSKIEKALSLCDNIYDFDLDILIDAGLTTIWAYVAEDSRKVNGTSVTYPGDCEFNARKYIENNVGTNYELLTRSTEDYTKSVYYETFNTIRSLFNTFCEKTRKDCMYLLDPLRATFIRGRDTKLMSIDGKIFSIDVYRALKNLYANANSSYGASYANWVKIYDSFNSEYIWMPSSPYEASIMATVDANYYPWYAPYGLNNGILSTITDIAIRMSPKQQDDIYKMGLNMFVFFNGDGFVSWGQKTLQTKAGAFDRISVRRLFLTLERSTFKTVRYFIAEPNTSFTRTRVVSSLNPIFETAKANEGCYDFAIYCNEVNNTAQVIDNNELVVDVYIKPTRVIDFIQVTFHATRTDADFDELFNS